MTYAFNAFAAPINWKRLGSPICHNSQSIITPTLTSEQSGKLSALHRVSTVASLGIDSKGNVYAATDNGVFMLAQGSNTWVSANQGLPRFEANASPFLLDNKTGILYLSTFDGIYKRESDSTKWVLFDDGEGFLPFEAKYGSGTALHIHSMTLTAKGKFCLQTNWGVFLQK
ncbi:MAG: hypothetical protein Q7V63_00560 [Gammaproteobacteria bacterium]|nr:hypothetical protein [Gammaproteobacteria bacterium]